MQFWEIKYVLIWLILNYNIYSELIDLIYTENFIIYYYGFFNIQKKFKKIIFINFWKKLNLPNLYKFDLWPNLSWLIWLTIKCHSVIIISTNKFTGRYLIKQL